MYWVGGPRRESSGADAWNVLRDTTQSYSVGWLSLVPRLFGGGEKRAWYLLVAHALNYSTFQIFWISPGASVLCWRHQPISRTLNLYVREMDRSCTLLNASAVLLWLWKTNKQLASRPSMKERMYFSDCLQVLASQCAMKYCPSCLMTS